MNTGVSWAASAAYASATAVLLMVTSPTSANAQHLFTDAHIGAAWQDGQLNDGPGFGTRVQLGGGGRLGGSPLRVFGFGSVAVSYGSGETGATTLTTELARTWLDYGVGVRLLYPFTKHVRLYGDMQLGE